MCPPGGTLWFQCLFVRYGLAASNGGTRLFRKQLMNLLAPVVKDPLHVALYFQSVNDPPQNAEGQRVSNDIDHFSSIVVRFKPVRVVP